MLGALGFYHSGCNWIGVQNMHSSRVVRHRLGIRGEEHVDIKLLHSCRRTIYVCMDLYNFVVIC